MASIKNPKAWLADEANIKKEEGRLEDTRRHALLDHPFMGERSIRAKLALDPKVKTACTNGTSVKFSPLFTALLSSRELIGVFLHELLHVALGHHVRRGNRNAQRWNIACDYVVNRVLHAAGIALPEGALINPEFDELSEEEIYVLLKQQGEGPGPKRPPEEEEEGEDGEGNGPPREAEEEDEEAEDEEGEEGEGNGPTREAEEDEDTNDGDDGPDGDDESDEESDDGSDDSDDGSDDGSDESDEDSDEEYELPDPKEWGEVEDAEDENGEPLSEKERDKELVKQAIGNESAKRLADMIGNGTSGGFSDALDGAWKNSTYDWEEELRDFVTKSIAGDPTSTWSRPDRRMIGNGLYLPGTQREGVGRIAICSDCSGSVGSDEFDLGLAQCEKIINDLPVEPEAVVWIQFDDSVKSVEVFESGARFENPDRSGYGGTLVGPPLKWLVDSGEEYVCIIFLTDMGIFDWRTVPVPDCPVVWADTYGGRSDPPFGKHIRITANK